MMGKNQTTCKIFLTLFFLLMGISTLMAQDRPKRPFKNKKNTPINTPLKKSNQDSLIRPNRPLANTPKSETGNDSDTTSFIILEKANEIEGFQNGGEEIRFLKGGVVLTQDDVIFYCDSAYWYTKQNAILAWDEVTIVQADTTQVFSDTLRYFGATKDAYLMGDVVLSDSTQQLFTDRLDYNLDTKIAEYYTGGVIKNNDSQLTSTSCIYNTNTKDAFFKDSVILISEDLTLKADSLNYNTETEFSEFIGPTLILEDSAKIYTESGFYDGKEQYAEFDKNPQYVKGDKIAVSDFMKYDGKLKKVFLEGNAKFREKDKFATSDKMVYDESTDISRLEGNAIYKDENRNVTADVIVYDGKNDSYSTEGKTIAQGTDNYIEADNSRFDSETNETILTGNVYLADEEQILKADEIRYNEDTGDAYANGKVDWRDTVNQVNIKSDELFFNDKTEYVKALGRPIMTTLLDGDTLYLSADTLISEKISINGNDSIELLTAYRDVRIYKKDFQAVCDSMAYNSTDSIFAFYENPIMWSDSTQFSADTTKFSLKDEKIDSVFLLQNALIIDTPDEQFFNQIQGREIVIKFEDNQPLNMSVNGNGTSVYYVMDDDEGYVGPNKTTCSSMYLTFDDGELEYIRFYGDPKSNLYPMKEANHNELKLKGFKWAKDKRPFSPQDLDSPHYIVEDTILDQEIINRTLQFDE